MDEHTVSFDLTLNSRWCLIGGLILTATSSASPSLCTDLVLPGGRVLCSVSADRSDNLIRSSMTAVLMN